MTDRCAGLLQHTNRDPQALAAELERNVTPQEEEEWEKGSIEDWVLEDHKLAQSVAYGDLASEDLAPVTSDYERQAEPVVELHLEKGSVRLAYLLNKGLH